jgi:hypothetical protein
VSAPTLATQSHLLGDYRPRRHLTTDGGAAVAEPGGAPSAVAPSKATMAVHLTGASMRLLEVSLAVAAIATALLVGIGR